VDLRIAGEKPAFRWPRGSVRLKQSALADGRVHDTVPLMSTVVEIETAFEKLSSRDKEEFALWYEERLTKVGPDPEIDQLWAVEIQRRLDEIRSGKVQAIPGEQVMADLRRRYGV
jgi:putative addiction module component (TIGR02574 family)